MCIRDRCGPLLGPAPGLGTLVPGGRCARALPPGRGSLGPRGHGPYAWRSTEAQLCAGAPPSQQPLPGCRR
eukprot:8027251-Alexandrium_andersonii.AAC.1